MKGKDMKRITALTAALLMLAGMTGCKGKNSGSDSSADTQPATFSALPEDGTEETTKAETTPAAEKSTETAMTEAAATTDAKSADKEKATTATAAESSGDTALFEYNNDGAIAFSEPAAEQSDSDLIAAGQALFRSACETDWSFTVGSPYELDMSRHVENKYGWEFYLVTTPGKNSIADVEKDYYKVFSDRYPTALHEVFMEEGGHVYSLNGERGINNYYQYSQITGITSRTEDEIFFNVKNYFDGTPYGGPEPYVEEDEFSAVIGSDGVWKAGKFRLPY